MILGAGLLLLVGVGLFVAGLATGVNALYWACVGVCAVAAVLIFLARRQTPVPGTAPASEAAGTKTPASKTPASEAPVPEEADEAAEPANAAEEPAATGAQPPPEEADPPVEEVEVTDLLLVVDLTDEVLVVDEHPRYHLVGCRWLAGRETFPLPLDEARTDGFTPCGLCEPDRRLAEQARARKAAKDS